MEAPYAYVDTSALVKLVVAEAETAALEHDLAARAGLLCSALGATELLRACQRGLPRRYLGQVDEVVSALVLLDVTPAILSRAAALAPADLRTLDAIHLATVLSLDDSTVEIVTYDARMARAARAHGLRTVHPGT
jgi:uncharacterized protein